MRHNNRRVGARAPQPVVQEDPFARLDKGLLTLENMTLDLRASLGRSKMRQLSTYNVIDMGTIDGLSRPVGCHTLIPT